MKWAAWGSQSITVISLYGDISNTGDHFEMKINIKSFVV